MLFFCLNEVVKNLILVLDLKVDVIDVVMWYKKYLV